MSFLFLCLCVHFLTFSFLCLVFFLVCSWAFPIIQLFSPTLIFVLCHHCSSPKRTHVPFGFFLLYLVFGLVWFDFHACVCLSISLCASVCSSVLLVFMAAPSLSSHFLPQITAAEQQPVSRAAAAAAAAVTVSSADPSWKLHARGIATTASTALAEWSLRFHTRARCAPPPSLPPLRYPRTFFLQRKVYTVKCECCVLCLQLWAVKWLTRWMQLHHLSAFM